MVPEKGSRMTARTASPTLERATLSYSNRWRFRAACAADDAASTGNPVGSSGRNYDIHRHQVFPSSIYQVFAHLSARRQNHISGVQIAEKQRRLTRT